MILSQLLFLIDQLTRSSSFLRVIAQTSQKRGCFDGRWELSALQKILTGCADSWRQKKKKKKAEADGRTSVQQLLSIVLPSPQQKFQSEESLFLFLFFSLFLSLYLFWSASQGIPPLVAVVMRHCRVDRRDSAGTGTSGKQDSRRRKKENNRRRAANQSPKHRSEKREVKIIASTQGEGGKLAGDGGAVLLVGWRGRREEAAKLWAMYFFFFFSSLPPHRHGKASGRA
ncbi:hypothetical protein V8C35DRAFT_75651 [Trichoderma chlorosporum]